MAGLSAATYIDTSMVSKAISAKGRAMHCLWGLRETSLISVIGLVAVTVARFALALLACQDMHADMPRTGEIESLPAAIKPLHDGALHRWGQGARAVENADGMMHIS